MWWRSEASHYLYSRSVIAKRCPNSRFVISWRNPLERLFSEYLNRFRVLSLTETFEDVAFLKLTLIELAVLRGLISNFDY